jgi:signal transduction histidine kinase/CheY-like chemotaxis protein
MLRDQLIEEIRDERTTFLKWILGGVALAGAVLFFSGPFNTPNMPAPEYIPWAVLAFTVIFSYLLVHVKRGYAAALICVIGLTLAGTTQLWLSNLQVQYYVLMLVPVGLAGLLLEDHNVWDVSIFGIVCMYAVTAERTSLLGAVPQVVFPAGVSLAIAGVFYAKSRALVERLNWAIDVQSKDTRRAESFYDKNEELQEALLKVQFYSSKLENLNKQLEEAQQRADRASKAKSVFLSNMSHELRTPLNVVIGYSSSMLSMPHMFENTTLPEVYAPYLKLIEENGHYLVGLINDILDLSKIEAGKVELQCVPMDITELCRGVMATSIGLLKGKPIQIRSTFPDILPLVNADGMRVRQIILNLMSNAVKFTESGSITVSAEVVNDFVHISVTDTGIGIPQEAQAVIFDRFEQAERDTERKFGGTGLGLDISKQLSLMHGGDLTVRSEAGKGSTFTLTLPVANEPALVMNGNGSKPKMESGIHVFNIKKPETLAEPHLIVLVEDEAGTRQMMRQSLESAGHVVVDTNSGTEAVSLVEGLLPAVVILDVFLNDMNGWEVLQKLRSNSETASIPVIMCTVDAPPADFAPVSNYQYLQKPVTPETILRHVEKVLPVAAALTS